MSKDIRKGALHRQLHVPHGEPISTAKLKQIQNADIGDVVRSKGYDVPVTGKLKKRANFAMSFR